MRLAVDCTSLLHEPTGVGVFAREVVFGVAAKPEVDLTVYAVSWRGREVLADRVPESARRASKPMAARPLRRAWLRYDRPSIEWWTGPVDVVHGPNFLVPPARHAASVVTVHDLTCIRFPELCTKDTLEYPALIRRAIRRGAFIHTVSASVADEVRETFEVDPERVVAISNGVNVPGAGDPRYGDPSVGRRLAGAERYILGLGTIEPRKDFPTLIRAFDLLAHRVHDVRLVVAGPNGWGVDAFDDALGKARHRDRIVRLGWVDDRQRSSLLRGASVFAFPSIYEGFGLPPLEAMSAGAPVVCSGAGAVADTVGDAAKIIAAKDPVALADALEMVLEDEAVANELRRLGTLNIERFSWERTVDELVELYRTACA